jgi:hypothetical protein|tara:strand:- start:123 stop:413 length:291 start_codon:yes stop_codon:yes gene_type:complete
MSDLNNLVVNTDEEREQWKKMLKAASDYHYDMSGQFEPEDPEDDPEDLAVVAKIHRAWGRAIQDSVNLIDMWALEEEIIEVNSTPPAKNVTPDEEE